MKYSAVILLAGKSSRFNGDVNKVYYEINNKPIFSYALDKFIEDQRCEKIVLVYNECDKKLLDKYHFVDNKIVFTKGGNERYISVLNGLKSVETQYVLVHDGARPFITAKMIDDVVSALKTNECVSVGLLMTDTFKRKNQRNNSLETVSREGLYSVQTPQGCKTELLVSALNKVCKNDSITDDLMAIEKYTNVIPEIVIGDKRNIKVTTKEDIELIQMFLNNI